MQFPYKNKIDKFLVEICRFTGADDRICAFSGAVSHKAVLCVRSRSLLPIGVHLSRPYKALTMPCLTGNSSRSAIINCRLCRQVCHYPTAVRQSVLLPQNGSHPSLPVASRRIENSRTTNGDTAVLVEVTGICPKGRASKRRQLSHYFPNYFLRTFLGFAKSQAERANPR